MKTDLETKFRIIQIMFMRLVVVYLQTITVTLLGVHNLDRKLIKELEDETFMFKLDINRLVDEYENT